MLVGTRIIDERGARTFYPGDELEGSDAVHQVAFGNAEPIPEEAEQPKRTRPAIEQATARPGELR